MFLYKLKTTSKNSGSLEEKYLGQNRHLAEFSTRLSNYKFAHSYF